MIYIEDMHDRYIFARWAYLMGETYLSDIEYDKLEKEFRAKYPEDYHSNQPWSFDECPVDILRNYGREDLICETVMGYYAESIPSINTVEEYKEKFGALNIPSRLSYKIDGWNTRVSYFNGHIVRVGTRGRSGNNLIFNNIASLFPQSIPYKGRVSVTGELNIPNDAWKVYKDITGNSDQRASVRTALANDDVQYLSFLAFNIFIEDAPIEGDQYQILKSLGFKTPMYKMVKSFAELDKMVKYFSMMDKGYNHLTDGLVLENSEFQLAIRIGKWEEKTQSSFVEGYHEKQGMYGYSIEILMHPVLIGGRKCSRVAVYNCATIEDNELRIGSPIAFNIRSAANSVLDVSTTFRLQQEWAGRYAEYQEKIMERERGNK